MEALTANPADILRLNDRVGALEPGRDGDVVVWSGDPLAVDSRVQRVFIEGRAVYAPTEGLRDAARRRALGALRPHLLDGLTRRGSEVGVRLALHVERRLVVLHASSTRLSCRRSHSALSVRPSASSWAADARARPPCRAGRPVMSCRPSAYLRFAAEAYRSPTHGARVPRA